MKCSASLTLININDGNKGDTGASAVSVSSSLGSYVFPANSSGIVSSSEYAKFSVGFVVRQGSVVFSYASTLTNGTFNLSRIESGITNTAINSSGLVVGTSSSIMANDSAKITVTVNFKDLQGKTGSYFKEIVFGKSKQGNVGATGLTGQYTAYQYYASTSDTSQVGGTWSATVPSISGGKFLWMRTQIVPAGGTISSSWGTPVLAGTDISKLMATISTVDGKTKTNASAITANAKQIITKVTKTDYDNDRKEIESQISQNAEAINFGVFKKVPDANGGYRITLSNIEVGAVGDDGYILLDAKNVIAPGSITTTEIDTESLHAHKYTIKDGGSIETANGNVVITEKEAIFNDVTANGNITASQINHPSITTFDSSSPVSANYNMPLTYSSLNMLYSNVIDILPKINETVNITYGGVVYTKAGIATNENPTNQTKGNPNSGGAIQLGRYYSVENIWAGRYVWMISPLKNTTGKPLAINASWSLGGFSNDCYVVLYNASGSEIRPLGWEGCGNFDFWLMPNWQVGIYAYSDAWWGERTATACIYVSEQFKYPHDSIVHVNNLEVASSSSNETATNYYNFTVPSGAKYCKINYIGGLSTSEHTEIKIENASYVNGFYKIIDTTKPVKFIIIAKTTYDSDSGDAHHYTIRLSNLTCTFYSVNCELNRRGIFLTKSNAIDFIDCSFAETNVNNWTNKEFLIDGVDKTTKTMLRGDDVSRYLSSKLNKYGSFFLDQNSQNRLTINGTILPATSKVTGVIFYEQNLTLQTEDSQKINIDISANKIYSYFNIALNFILSPVKIQTTNIEPGGNNLYSLGIENFWKSIKVNEINMSEQYYSKNSNGYTYLPNGLLLQWGRANSVKFENIQISFNVPFIDNAYSVMATVDCQSEISCIQTGMYNKNNFTLWTDGAGLRFWMAIGI